MPETPKRSTGKRAPKQGILTPLQAVERDMRRTVQRKKNIRKLQTQIRRELAKSREKLGELVLFLQSQGFVVTPPAPSTQERLV